MRRGLVQRTRPQRTLTLLAHVLGCVYAHVRACFRDNVRVYLTVGLQAPSARHDKTICSIPAGSSQTHRGHTACARISWLGPGKKMRFKNVCVCWGHKAEHNRCTDEMCEPDGSAYSGLRRATVTRVKLHGGMYLPLIRTYAGQGASASRTPAPGATFY